MRLIIVCIHLCIIAINQQPLKSEKTEIHLDDLKKFGDAINCPADSFRCDIVQCLPYAFVCNGEFNCQDRTDELNCSVAIINNNLCNRNDSINCEQDILHTTRFVDHDIRFEYNRPVQICIKRSSVCDGVIDCRHAIDEQCTQRNPLISCTSNEYHCRITNRCIPKTWLCNGVNDCLDPFSSDELDCPKARTCSSNEFSCQSKNQCVPLTAVCDGIQDCADGSDESDKNCRFPRFCTHDQFTCKSSKLCIPKSNLCDTITQCHDRSDEMSCSCPIEDYVSQKLFFRCGLTDKCLPKNIECYLKHECNAMLTDHSDEELVEDPECLSSFSGIERPCSSNNTCPDENQYCRSFFHKRCVCQAGYRINESTGMCEDINECRERLVCDHYCINTMGSYQCSCNENYQLKSDKHTCALRSDISSAASLFGLFSNGIHRLNLTKQNELEKLMEWSMIPNHNQTLILRSNNTYLIDHDPIENYLYYAECVTPIRSVILSCAKTRGIFRINLNESKPKAELIIDGHDYTSIQSLAIDWLHRNIYFVNTRLQTIDVCRLNGSFCHVLLHQTISDYLPLRLVLYPEKGFIFYTSVVKSRAQHVVRLGMDGTNLKLLFTIKTSSDMENANYLRPLLTFDQINHHLYFYNGFDKIFTLNMHGDVLHVQHQAVHRFHAFRVHADKMYKALFDVNDGNRSEFRINPKHAIGTTLLGPGFIFDLNRVVQTFQNKTFRFGQGSWTLNSLHNLYYLRYPIHLTDFIFMDPNWKPKIEDRCDQCEQLCFPNALNQSELVCACSQYYNLADDGRSCLPSCPPHFFNCPISKKCIPFYQQCDGHRDCPFNEDENACQDFTCPSRTNETTFRCSSDRKCLTRADLCNNVTDCPNGEDESDLICGHFCEWPSLNNCNKKYPNLCPEREFYCDGKCVSISYRCDATPHCYDAADEPFDCINVTCPDDYFKCSSTGKCISMDKVCDNYADCPIMDKTKGTSDDETSESCNFILTQFSNSTSTLKPPSRVPLTCESADLFRCKTSSFCINRTYVCDGDLDCSDSSDEENCDEHPGLFSLSVLKDFTCINGYRCSQQRHEQYDYVPLCIPLTELCDGIKQCPLGDDEHKLRCQNCTNCDTRTSFCELINRVPSCQCKNGYAKLANGTCVIEQSLCNWSFGTCPHANLSKSMFDDSNCSKKKSTKNTSHCQCDRGYKMEMSENSLFCVAHSNRTIDVHLNPRSLFTLEQYGIVYTPINPSHHVIDAAFVPHENGWILLYTEQRDGRGYIWQQKIDFILHQSNRSDRNPIQIWSSPFFHLTSIEVDWIHRLVYVLFDDPSSSSNGIEIMHSPTNDFSKLIVVNRLTFSNTKTLSSVHVHPYQGYVYISAYYDAQHSLVYRSLLDGSNLETFITLNYPVLGMTLDYRHPRLYVMLSNGDIESYATDASQPWKTRIYSFKNIRPYSIDLHDDTLVLMIYNQTDLTYDETWIDKFGRIKTDMYRKFQTPMIVRYIHEFKYPTPDRSDLIKPICSESTCSQNRICITTPTNRPLCITPGQLNICGSSCHTRGICSNGQCVCLNRTYIGDDCEMCRLTNQINVGCIHVGLDAQPPCMCYLSKSSARQTPYLCTVMRTDQGETEVPCDRLIAPLPENKCSRTLFLEPPCDESSHRLIYHRETQTCLCRENHEKLLNCYNNGLLLIDDENNSTTCSCSAPFSGIQCEVNLCQNRCQNNGTCTVRGDELHCRCRDGFYGEQCELDPCQAMFCENNGKCLMEKNRTICRCTDGFTGAHCHLREHFRWTNWIIQILLSLTFLVLIYAVIRHHTKILRLKHLFAHHRLHEQISLEINTNSTAAYSHLPTSEQQTSSFRTLNDERGEENAVALADLSLRADEYADDPFYLDEKQPIFSGERTNGRSKSPEVL